VFGPEALAGKEGALDPTDSISAGFFAPALLFLYTPAVSQPVNRIRAGTQPIKGFSAEKLRVLPV
jgi:hypothetical protein